MESKKINQLATNVAPVASDLTIVGDPTTGVSKKVTLSQIASLFAGAVDFYTNLAAFPATGVLNTIYCAKDTQKLYLWSGSAYVETFPSQAVLNTYQLLSAKGVANGYAGLDSAGKVPIAQLPSSIMEYKGLWSAATNTPTLANGTGDTGDVYIASSSGSVNFGAGAITFAVGDYVIYSGSIWQRSSGAVGTVTSVGLSSATSGVTIGSSPVTTSGTITLAIATATTSQNGLLSSTDWATFNAKQNALTLTTTGTSGASTLVGATLNIPNYGSALTGYVPYTGATQDVDLGAFKLNAQSLHIKGTAGNGHLGLKHQSASATASANEVSLFADSLGDLSWLNGNLYLSKFITSGNTAARSYTFPNANGTVALTSDLSAYVTLATTQTITGAKTFTATSITLAPTSSGGVLNLKQDAFLGATNGYTSLTSSGSDFAIIAATGISTSKQAVFSLASLGAILRTYTFPDASGTIALVGGSGVGTVTSVAALTIGTTGTDLSSSVANSTTTPVITLNVPTASATNRGALSSADWTTFNNKQGTITLTTTGTSGAATFSANTLNIPNYGSALSGYLPLTGGTLTGPLSGTSATFSSYIETGGGLKATGNSISSGNGAEVLYAGGNGYFQSFNRTTSAYLPTILDGLNLSIQTGGTPRLTIASTGAATFSGDFTAYGTFGSFGQLHIAGATDSNKKLAIGYNTSANVGFIQAMQNGTAYSPLLLNSSGGNVLIGTTSDNGQKLQIKGNARFNYSDDFGYFGLGYVSGADYGFYNYNYGRIDLKITQSTGAATFSSSVTASSFFESSDSRLKTLIQDNYQTKGIASITPKLYTKNGKVELGYYAQDFIGVLDSAVSKGSDEMLSLSYREVLVAKVYALEQEIKELKAK